MKITLSEKIEFLTHCVADSNNDGRATELHDILKNCYSEWDMKH